MKLHLPACLLLCPLALFAQTAPPRPASPQPIPKAATLLRQVVARQRQVDTLRENYTYRQHQIVQKLDSHGHIQSTKIREYRVFFVHTHEIDELIGKDGRPLTPAEQRKQQKIVQRLIAQAENTPPGQSPGQPTVSVSQLLSIMKLSSLRRAILDGRPTLVFDFTGNRRARSHGKAERTLRKLKGTIWIDETDREVRRLTAHFDANFHEGWGLVSVAKGSTFTFTQRPMHGQLWLPAGAQIQLTAHALAFIGYRVHVTITDSDYKVFHAGAKQIPKVRVVPPASKPPQK